MRRALALGGWLVLAPMAGVVLFRLIGLESRSAAFTALLTVTLWLLLPAWAVLGLAAGLRNRRLAAAAGAVVLAHLVWVLPDLRWWSLDQPDAGGTRLRIVASNVLHVNPEPAAAARVLAMLRPDVLVLTELTPPMQAAVDELGWRHRYEEPHASPDAFGMGIYSRHPIVDRTRLVLGGRPHLQVTLRIGDDEVTVIGVHTLQPLARLSTLQEQLADLSDLADTVDGPLVMAGDFNATRQHAPFRALMETRMRDAHLESGRGRATSWRDGGRLPPLALLDHVLVSDGVAVEATAERDVPGSDHRAVVATIRLP